MENAAKALTIAANVLLAVMILSLILFVYNRIRIYPQEKDLALAVEQAHEFNKQFEVYDKRIMYGVDVLSAVNKAISNNEKYIQGKWLSGYFSSTEFAIDIQVVLKEPLEEKVQVYYHDTTQVTLADNTVTQNNKADQPYTNGDGITKNNVNFETISNNSAITWPKLVLPPDTYLGLYKNFDSWDDIKIKTQNIDIVTEFDSNPDYDEVIDGRYIYRLLDHDNDGKCTKDNIDDDNYLKTLVSALNVLTKADKQVVNHKAGETITGTYLYSGEGPDAWSSIEWTPAVSDFKNRKFKCVGIDDDGKPTDEPGIVYNEKTGAICKLTFVEIGVN